MQGSARGEARKREVMAAALDVALERAFTALTLDEVARTANASKTTLMRFFGGRRGLVEAALALEMELVVGPLQQAADDVGRFGSALQEVIFSDRCLGLRALTGQRPSPAQLDSLRRRAVVQVEP